MFRLSREKESGWNPTVDLEKQHYEFIDPPDGLELAAIKRSPNMLPRVVGVLDATVTIEPFMPRVEFARFQWWLKSLVEDEECIGTLVFVYDRPSPTRVEETLDLREGKLSTLVYDQASDLFLTQASPTGTMCSKRRVRWQ